MATRRRDINGYERPALEELIRWRLWNRTAAGLMAELGSHQLDASSIFISAQNPRRTRKNVTSIRLPSPALGGRSIFPERPRMRRPRLLHVRIPGTGILQGRHARSGRSEARRSYVTYSSINGNGYGGYGEIVFGTNGTLILEQEQDAMLFKGSSTSTQIEVVTDKKTGKPAMDTYETGGGAAVAKAAGGGGPVSRGYREEIEHWAWCIRNPAPKTSPIARRLWPSGDAVIALTAIRRSKSKPGSNSSRNWFDPASDETPTAASRGRWGRFRKRVPRERGVATANLASTSFHGQGCSQSISIKRIQTACMPFAI